MHVYCILTFYLEFVGGGWSSLITRESAVSSWRGGRSGRIRTRVLGESAWEKWEGLELSGGRESASENWEGLDSRESSQKWEGLLSCVERKKREWGR